jgi:hypothetical protein
VLTLATEELTRLTYSDRPGDVEVARPLGETETGSDAQLERAVKELPGTQ